MTKVQVISNQNAGGTSSSVGAGQGWAPSTAGNLLVVVAAIHLGGTPSVTDNLGSTYTLDYSFQTGRIAVFSLANNPGGIATITASSAFDTQKIAVFEYSGAATASPFGASAIGLDSGFGVTAWTTNTTGTTPAAGGIVLTIAYDWRSNGVLSIATAGYTSDVALANAGGTWAIWDKADAGSTTYSASGSMTVAGQIVAGIVTYKASGGAPPAGGLFVPVALNGIGSGGPFFGNPIGMQ